MTEPESAVSTEARLKYVQVDLSRATNPASQASWTTLSTRRTGCAYGASIGTKYGQTQERDTSTAVIIVHAPGFQRLRKGLQRRDSVAVIRRFPVVAGKYEGQRSGIQYCALANSSMSRRGRA